MEKTISMGAVSLWVHNLTQMSEFYEQVIGLDHISTSGSVVTLGHKDLPLVVLHKSENASYVDPTHAGLYHLAIVFASRMELSKTLLRILSTARHHFIGSADHIVSVAFYITDPEGNGIELYFDKDKTTWQWKNGKVNMGTMYIDPAMYIQTYLGTKDAEHQRQIGHVHLKVGDIAKARVFYVSILNFDITAELPGALFLSRDSYHHHIGLNTWESDGADRRIDISGLKSFEVIMHNEEEFDAISRNLLQRNVDFAKVPKGISLHDPWGNEIVLLSPKS